jgi:hypothetical protein
MSETLLHASTPSAAQPLRRRHHVPGETGIWVFIFGDMLVFAIMFATYLYYRGKNVALFNASQQLLNPDFGLVNTLLLLTSSLFVVRGLELTASGQLGAPSLRKHGGPISGRRSACLPFPGRVRLDVVLGAEAAVNVVIDHAVVLHERAHARGTDEWIIHMTLTTGGTRYGAPRSTATPRL